MCKGNTHRSSSFHVNADEFILRKVGRVFNVILICMLGILIRVWYLAVVQHEKHVEEAHKPQRRTAIEHMGRASIRDRFNLPLALNKVQYQAAVCYSHLRQIPSIRWEKDSTGKKVRVQARLRHIKELSLRVGDILHLDPLFIEDIVHAKAALVPHAPFVIKEDISEAQYYRLRAMEKDCPGLMVQRASRRFYPRGKIACDVLGSMGAISGPEYEKFTEELAELEGYIAKREAGENPFLPKGFATPFAVRQRLLELQERAYTIHDFVGRTGVEASFDEELRGYSGRKVYEVDVKGNFLRELPGSRPPLPGQRLLLTISAELQEFAEQLLAESEAARIKTDKRLEEPWIKGGAIVAVDPNTGEVLALASHPRFDPNDFIAMRRSSKEDTQKHAVRKWLENESHIGEIWDGRVPLEREMFGKNRFLTESVPLTWENYLEGVLPSGPMRDCLSKRFTVRCAVNLQRALMILVRYSGLQDAGAAVRMLSDSTLEKEASEPYLRLQHPALQSPRRLVEEALASADETGDKLLIVDLCRLAVPQETMTPALLEAVGSMTLSQFFLQRQAFLCLQEEVFKKAEQLFAVHDFTKWRDKHFKAFLKIKRREEREQGRYAKPYTEYLEQLKKRGFTEFWDLHRLPIMEALLKGCPFTEQDRFDHADVYSAEIKPIWEKALSKSADLASLEGTIRPLAAREAHFLLRSFRSFSQLDQPLWGRYPRLRNEKGLQLQRHLAGAFYPIAGYSYGRSQAFRQTTPVGSVFKVIIAYQALVEKYQKCAAMHQNLRNLNPLVLTDYSPQQRKKRDHDTVFGKTSDGKPITRLYKGGRLPRSSHAGIGQVDLLGALEQSSNIYFSILAAEEIDSPEQLLHTVRQFGYGERSGIELPGETPGNLPDDISTDKSALYSFAIGQHTLLVTPLQTAMMMATLAGQGQLLRPSIVQVKAGKQRVLEDGELFYRSDFSYRDVFESVGVHFPLFTALEAEAPQLAFSYAPVQVRHSIFLPREVREMVMEGMRRVVTGPLGSARLAAVRPYCFSSSIYQDYVLYSNQLAGKTGTAEILYKQTIDLATKAAMNKHTWFAVASYPQRPEGRGVDWEHPDLVVVVYLRFAAAGREAAPLAVQIMKKWRELRDRYGATSHVQAP